MKAPGPKRWIVTAWDCSGFVPIVPLPRRLPLLGQPRPVNVVGVEAQTRSEAKNATNGIPEFRGRMKTATPAPAGGAR